MSPRILHIEDDAANRLLVRKILVDVGFEVLEAHDGLEGVRMAREHHPDLVLVDLNVPGLDGYEVTLRLRGDPALQDIPIVAITAEGDRTTSLAVGCDGFIQKPIDVRSFASTLQHFIQGTREVLTLEETGAHLRAQSQRIVARLEAKVDELSKANQDLLDAEKARTAFYRNISHELATPMTPIVGYVKLLLDQELGPLGPSQSKALLAMDGCVQRLRALIDNLLDVTGLEAGTMKFIYHSYDVGEVVKAALSRVQPLCSERSIRIVTEGDRGPYTALGDAGRLQRGIWQVLDNAVKFTKPGGEIGVSLRRSPTHFEVCVADNGPGIPPQLLTKVLEPFRQVDGSPTRTHQGVGIGLAIASRVAKGLGGGLILESPTQERIGGFMFRGTSCKLSVAVRPAVPASL